MRLASLAVIAAILCLAMFPSMTSAPGRALTDAEWAMAGGDDDLPAVGWVCRDQNETCPVTNSGVTYGVFCGAGVGTGCFSCTNWQTREQDCEITILSGCFIRDFKVVCGEKFDGTCTTLSIGGGATIKACQPVGAPIGTCVTNLDQC